MAREIIVTGVQIAGIVQLWDRVSGEPFVHVVLDDAHAAAFVAAMPADKVVFDSDDEKKDWAKVPASMKAPDGKPQHEYAGSSALQTIAEVKAAP